MIRTLLTRIAAGTLGLTLLALAATGAARSAHADGPVVLTPTGDPTTVSVPPDLPDLVVKFEKVMCGSDQWGTHLLFQMRIINMSLTVPANGTWQTDIRLDGVPVPGSPQVTTGPLWVTILYSYTLHDITPGWHHLSAYTDSTFKVTEFNELNNGTMYRFYCPASNPTYP